jgi:hypothetical protein
MTVSTATRTKCAKPAGSYCRLHNPEPKTRNFQNLDEVFQAVDRESASRINTRTVAPIGGPNMFQDIQQERQLPDGCPTDLADHARMNQEQLNHLQDHEKLAVAGYAGFAAGVCNSVLLGNKYEYYDEAPEWRTSAGPCDFVDREDLVDYMETLDSILENRQEEQQVLYRGIPIYAAIHDEIGASIGKNLHINDTEGLVEGLKEYYKPGKTFNFSTYLSTTKSADYAAERTDDVGGTKWQHYNPKPEIRGIVFELRTNAGLDITSAVRSHNTYERETVLPRDTYFKVVDVHVKPQTYATSRTVPHGNVPLGERVEYTQLAAVVQMVEVDKNGNEILDTKPRKPVPSIQDIIPAS